MKYEFKGIDFDIDEEKDENGVVVFSCINEAHIHPVFLRTNNVNMFQYKIGDGDDDEVEWGCCTSKTQLVENFIDAANICDRLDGDFTIPSWYDSTDALLHYIEWV